MSTQAIRSSTAGGGPIPAAPRQNGYWQMAWRRLRRDNAAILGLILVVIIVALSLLAPFIAPHDPAEQFRDGLTSKVSRSPARC